MPTVTLQSPPYSSIIPFNVRDLYTQVCDILCEPGGLNQDIMLDADFLNIAKEIIQEWCAKTGCYQKIVEQPGLFAVSDYTYPDYQVDVKAVNYSEKNLFQTQRSTNDLKALGTSSMFGRAPETWNEDMLEVKQIRVNPPPNLEAYQTSYATPMMGTASTIDGSPSGITVQYAKPFYGTIASFDGPMYGEFAGRYVGTLRTINTSQRSIRIIATVKPLWVNINLDSPVELIHRSFLPYLVYGILTKIFESDTEYRDVQRRQYCQLRWNEGLNLAASIMNEVLITGEQ